MTGSVRIAVLVVRVARRHPVTVTMGRVTVIAANPDVLSIPPLIVTGNPDGGAIGTRPWLIIFARLGRALRADVDAEGGVRRDGAASRQSQEGDGCGG